MAEHALKRPSSVSRKSRCALTLCDPADPSGSNQQVAGGASGAPSQNVPAAFLVEEKEDSIDMFITAEWMSKLFTSCLRGQVNCLRPIMLRGRVSLRIHRAGS